MVSNLNISKLEFLLNSSSPVVESEEPTSLLLTSGKQCIPASPRYTRLPEEHQGCIGNTHHKQGHQNGRIGT